jgi:CheY-like chemotaxis protein
MVRERRRAATLRPVASSRCPDRGDDNAGFLLLDAARGRCCEGQHVAVARRRLQPARRRCGAPGELRPDVALVDIDLGDEDGFEVARRLRRSRPRARSPR